MTNAAMSLKSSTSVLSGRRCQSKTSVVAKELCLQIDSPIEALPAVREAWNSEAFWVFQVFANYAKRC